MNPLTKASITALAIVVSGFAVLYVLAPWLPEPVPYYEIVERGRSGPFRIGMDRVSALAAATALGADKIRANLRYDQRHETHLPAKVDKFADAELIVVDFGAVVIHFSGDKVAAIDMDSKGIRASYRNFFDGVTTREEALDALRRLLAVNHVRVFMEVDKPPIPIGAIGETETRWLNHYDSWRFVARCVRAPDSEFGCNYALEFDGDRLVRIRILVRV